MHESQSILLPFVSFTPKSERTRNSSSRMETPEAAAENDTGVNYIKTKGTTSDEPSNPPPFLEVVCKATGTVRRFAVGTEAGFAANLINQKNDFLVPLALHIEAVREGEEPVSFGPNAILVNYGQGWKLQTVVEQGDGEVRYLRRRLKPNVQRSPNNQSSGDELSKPGGTITFVYAAKIFLAFVFMFVVGATFTLFLEYLPVFLSHVTSSSQ